MPSMKFTLISLSASALLGLSACATPATQTASAPAATTSAKTTAMTDAPTETASAEDSSRLVCKREAVVGSKFKKKICATQDVWDARAESDRKTAGDIQRGGRAPGVSN